MVKRTKTHLRLTQLEEFLHKVDSCKGKFSARKKEELGKHFLEIVMGLGGHEFVAPEPAAEMPDFIPQSEDYYPWALFISDKDDLQEDYHHRAQQYLHGDNAGKKNYVVVTNGKELCVFDFKYEVAKYTVDFDKLLGGDKKESENWQAFLADFSVESAKGKKKQRRKDVTIYTEPKDERLSAVKRFGHQPEFKKPIGWDNKNFLEIFKTKNLPFLPTEEFDWDGTTQKITNRIVWGDNLAVMRALPNESIDLIYIDPPFFSGRDYNCIFGDDNETRTFSDIWDGGLPTYLAWLNARLWEMKRLLKPTGSLFVHLDWHACHYVKCELDKIFGYDNFVNEVIWRYKTYQGKVDSYLPKKHDNIFCYKKGEANKFQLLYEENYEDTVNYKRWKKYFEFDSNDIPIIRYGKHPETDSRFCAYVKRWKKEHKRTPYTSEIIYRQTGEVISDVWSIQAIDPKNKKERIGYPTQKPEKLLERIIEACSNEGDVVADFFCGGGTTVAVAEKLNRKWIACDVSRIAVSVTRDRLQEVYSKKAGVEPRQERASYGFAVENHGAYEQAQVRNMETEAYKKFILQCYEAHEQKVGKNIHGKKGDKVICVAPARAKLTRELVEDFHFELADKKMRNGIILAWGWNKEVERCVQELRTSENTPDIQLIQVKLVDIDSHEFKGDNIRFLNKPVAVIRYKLKQGLKYIFYATASQGRNDTDIHCYQWDFNYKGRFKPMTKRNFDRSKDKDGDDNPLNDSRVIEHAFSKEGKYKVALRIIDKSGAEATCEEEIEVIKKAA